MQHILAGSLPSGHYKVWIAPISGQVEEKDGAPVLRLFAPTDFVAKKVRDRFWDVITEAAAAVLEQEPAIILEVRPPAVKSSSLGPSAASFGVKSGETPGAMPSASAAAGQNGVLQNPAKQALSLPQRAFRAPHEAGEEQLGLPLLHARAQAFVIDSRYSFENYVVGASNQFAVAAAKAVCDSDLFMDSLFLASGPGLGKTHLVQAMGNTLCRKSNRSLCRVEYLPAEEFGARFVAALKAKDMERFKARYASADVLLLEDVHFLQGKERMQAEVLGIVKTLQSRGARVVFSSSFAPRDLKDMDSQLASRFCSGALAVIDAPDFEMRKRLFGEKASLHQVLLPEPVADLLASQIKADVRQIESCIQSLILKARVLNQRISLDMAWEVLSQYAAKQPAADIEGIIRSVCQAFGLSVEQLSSKSHKQEYVVARNAVFYLARKHTELTLKEIGRRLNRTHATVIKGISTLEREIARETPRGRQISVTLSLVEKNSNLSPARSH